ncbi:MAG: hypothetical protein U0531_12415 [Dehalococcoidia bacterium]
MESGWRQATPATARGSRGSTIVSTSCAYGLMQVLTGMEIGATMTPKQQKIGGDYLSNTAGGAQLLGIKWNLGPEYVPVVTPRDPRRLESWYYAVWAYHCYGEVCLDLGIHNNPDDPALSGRGRCTTHPTSSRRAASTPSATIRTRNWSTASSPTRRR